MPDDLRTKKQPEKRTEKQHDKAQVLRARPVAGEVDWTELSREHIRRYPKIRARLAE